LHITSDVLNVEKTNNTVELQLFGNRDLIGEMVLEGNISQVKKVYVDNEEVKFKIINNRIAINYNHKHQTQISLKIIF
jgi:hypothetical protein